MHLYYRRNMRFSRRISPQGGGRAVSVALATLLSLALLLAFPHSSAASPAQPTAARAAMTLEEEGKLMGTRERDVNFERFYPPGYSPPSARLKGPRPPGTLLLNMLIKNERDHLDRTLPLWARLVDCWVIGVDDANTDDSEAVIRKHLGHIPGKIVTVKFDGMGPTWTELVQEGIKSFSDRCTHGIIADADFAPVAPERFDKNWLDVRCSKHMYTIWSGVDEPTVAAALPPKGSALLSPPSEAAMDLLVPSASSDRKMDWIYRNTPGAHVERRTHQILQAPAMPDQEVYQTLVPLHVTEQEGGYQDRTPGKRQRYIGFLEADLLDHPDDTRTLYYLGYAHLEMFLDETDNGSALHKASPAAWDAIRTSARFFERRDAIGTSSGNMEELYFTLLKLGEVRERFLGDAFGAVEAYRRAGDLDPPRGDAWFYLGQLARLSGRPEDAVEPLLRVARIAVPPPRSMFQWHELYSCLAPVELARAVVQLPSPSPAVLSETVRALRRTQCGRAHAAAEARKLLKKLSTAPAPTPTPTPAPAPAAAAAAAANNAGKRAERLLSAAAAVVSAWGTHSHALEGVLSAAAASHGHQKWYDASALPLTQDGFPDESFAAVIGVLTRGVRGFINEYARLASPAEAGSSTTNPRAIEYASQCRSLRAASAPLVRFLREHAQALTSLTQSPLDAARAWSEFTSAVGVLKMECF